MRQGSIPWTWAVPLILLLWAVPLKMLSLSIEKPPEDLPRISCAPLPAKSLLSSKVKVPFEAALFTLPTWYRAKVQSASIRPIADEPWYQFVIQGEGEPYYISAIDGREGSNEDGIYAEEIAGAYLGQSDIQQTQLLNRFDKDYRSFQKILPVYQFDSNDLEGDRVYVSTALGQVVFHKKMNEPGQMLTSLVHKAAIYNGRAAWNNT